MTFRNPHSLFMTPCTLITITSLAWSPIKLPPTCCSLGREVLHLNPKTVLSGDKTPKCSLVHGPSEQVIYLIRLLLAAATHAVNLFFATSVMSFYHMNLEVIADICFGARESVVKSWLPLLRSWTCQCVFFFGFPHLKSRYTDACISGQSEELKRQMYLILCAAAQFESSSPAVWHLLNLPVAELLGGKWATVSMEASYHAASLV